MIVVGLDLSTTSTGFARVQLQAGAEPDIRLHRVRSSKSSSVPKGERPTLRQRDDRLLAIEDRIAALAGELPRGNRGIAVYPDLLLIEGPSFGSKGNALHDLSGNWWRVVSRLGRHQIPMAEVVPVHVKQYATGRGTVRGDNAVTKEEVIEAARARFPQCADQLAGSTNAVEDLADALMLAAIGCRYLGHPIDGRLPAPHLPVLKKTRWPERTLV